MNKNQTIVLVILILALISLLIYFWETKTFLFKPEGPTAIVETNAVSGWIPGGKHTVAVNKGYVFVDSVSSERGLDEERPRKLSMDSIGDDFIAIKCIGYNGTDKETVYKIEVDNDVTFYGPDPDPELSGSKEVYKIKLLKIDQN